MQRGVRDSHSCDGDRRKARHRRNRSSTAYLKLHIVEGRDFFLGREFKRHRPTRGTGNKTQLSLVAQVVDLNHHAINVIAKLVAFSA